MTEEVNMVPSFRILKKVGRPKKPRDQVKNPNRGPPGVTGRKNRKGAGRPKGATEISKSATLRDLNDAMRLAKIDFSEELARIWPQLTVAEQMKFLVSSMPYLFVRKDILPAEDPAKRSTLIHIDTSMLTKAAASHQS